MTAVNAAAKPGPGGPLRAIGRLGRRVHPARRARSAPHDGRAARAHAGAHIATTSGPSPSATHPFATIASRTARSVV